MMPANPSRLNDRAERRAVAAALLTIMCVPAVFISSLHAQPFSGTPVLPRTRVVDGVRLLQHDASAFDRAPRLTIDTSPVAVLGGTRGDPDYDLTRAGDAVLLPDQRVVTLASVGNRLLVFRADGRGERSLGRTGQGPGELMAPLGMMLIRGDTLVIPDIGNRRLNLVLPDRGVVASEPIQDPSTLRVMRRPAGVLRSGQIVVYSTAAVERGIADSVVRPSTTVALLDRASGSAREIAKIRGLENVMIETRFRGRRDLQARTLRLGRRAHVAAWDTLIATAAGEGYEIDLRTNAGTVVSRLRVAAKRRPVTQAMRNAQIARELEQLEASGPERMVDASESRRLARETPFADSLPPYGQLFVTRDHTLWVVDPIAPGDTAWSATAFRRDGAILGRLRVSGVSLPMAFENDRVVLRAEDEDGVVALRIHRLVTRGSPAR